MVSVILLMDSGESVARTVSSRDSENPNIFNCLPKAKMVRWHSARAAAAISLSCSCTIFTGLTKYKQTYIRNCESVCTHNFIRHSRRLSSQESSLKPVIFNDSLILGIDASLNTFSHEGLRVTCRALLPASSDKNGSEISSLCKLREGQTRPTPLFTQSPRLYK